MPPEQLWQLGLKTIQELETEKGILASAREEVFGCIFGRDSLITTLKLLRAYENTGNVYFLNLSRKILQNLSQLQGKETNIESGEQIGKCIHEFRTEGHEHLTRALAKPWFVYPDGTLKNYDSVDATPLMLIAMHRYYKQSGDGDFLSTHLPHIYQALNWILVAGDKNQDGFVDYQLDPARNFGGLVTQSWMDSVESVFHEDGSEVAFPLAPVEVQGYAYLALKLWAQYFENEDKIYAFHLNAKAAALKKNFNEKFVVRIEEKIKFACAMDGSGKPLISLRSSIGHILWAQADGDCILEKKFIPELVQTLLQPDLFEPLAGIRTLSKKSIKFETNSYHNGSIWPHDNSMIIQGMINFGFVQEAVKVRMAILEALTHFQTPIELFVYDNNKHQEYSTPSGGKACRKQAWSAASLLLESQSK